MSIPSRPLEKVLEMEHGGFAQLMDDHAGNLGTAAYYYALLVNAVRSVGRPTPTGYEVYAAARKIASELGLTMWTKTMILQECRRVGLDVL